MRRVLRTLVSMVGMIAGVVVIGAGVGGAQIQGACTATVAGQDVETATSPSSAIEVGHDDVVSVAGTDPSGAPFTKIQMRFPPLPDITVYDEEHDPPSPTWGGEVNVADYATYGVGLYQVKGSTDDCSGTAWIKVTGKSPFTTVAGLVGTGIAAAGAIGAAVSIARATPGWSSVFRSLGRGAVLGVGAAILAQQFGLTPLTGAAVAGWVGAGAATAGLGNLGVSTLRAGAAAAT